MTAHLSLPRPTASRYLESNSLIIQFVLSEMIEAFAIIDKVEQLLPNLPETPPKRTSAKTREVQDALMAAITKLAGSSQEYMRIFTWNPNDGTLTKLKNYCSFFATLQTPLDPDVMALQRHADRAWANCIDALGRLRAAQLSPLHKDADPVKLKSSLEKMITRLRSLAKTVAAICGQFRDDENVLFFILSHQEALDRLYKTDFVFITFCKLFPKGLVEAEKLLLQRFGARGFDQLLPVIVKKIAALDMDMALV